MMMAAFSRAIASTVGPRCSMWSRSTFVMAATPPSHACVASSRPPRPTSTTARSTSCVREVAEGERGQQLELGRWAVATSDAIGDRQPGAHEPREVGRGDRATGDLDPLAVGDEMRLGRLADPIPRGGEAGTHERHHAALAVGPADERAAEARARGCRGRPAAPGSGPAPGGSRTGRATGARRPTRRRRPGGRRPPPRSRAQVVLVEDALVEAGRRQTSLT